MQELQESLVRFSPIALTTIGFENLLRRYDTKFIIPKDETLSILQTLVPYYQVLEIDNRRIFLNDTARLKVWYKKADKPEHYKKEKGGA